MFGDIPGGKAQPGTENGSALEIIGGDVGEPFFQVFALDGGPSASRGRAEGQTGEQ
jgi:hypothetical protein